MADRVGEVSDKADSAEQSGQELNAEKEEVSVDVKERITEKVRVGGAFRAKEVASVCVVEVVGENKVDREIAGQNCGVGFRVNKNSWRKMGNRVGEVSNKADSVEQSGQKHNAGKEVVPVDVKERTYEKVRVRGAYKGKKNSGKQMVDRVGEGSDKADSVEQSGQECNAEKEKVSVDLKERTNEKVTVSGAFCAYSAKETEEVTTVCTVEVVEENKVDREISGKKHRVGFKGKKPSWRKISDRVGEVSDKANSVEQSGRECNAEKEKVSVDVKERTNEKVRVKGAFSDKEVEEVATVCTVEVVEEIKVDRKIAGKKRRVWYRGKKHSGRKMADRVGEVSDKADSAEQSGQELNAEKEEVSVDVKERANEKARVRGAFCAYSDKSKDVLIDSEAGLNRTIEGDLGDLSLTDRRYGHGRSSVRVYGDKSYGSSRKNDVRKMLKQRDNSFVWIKKGESSNGNVAEIETQG
uniref:RCG54054 n=1 Tax=Solanum tuberosum TaxID=4113 RepID=M1ATV7_SOLTU